MNDLLDDYNEESDQDWASGGSESDSEDSLLDQELLSHPAFQVGDDESLGDVDIDGPEEEGVYSHGKSTMHYYFLCNLFMKIKDWTSYTEEEMEKLRDEVKEIGLMKFVNKYIIQASVPVPKLLQVFNIYMVKLCV